MPRPGEIKYYRYGAYKRFRSNSRSTVQGICIPVLYLHITRILKIYMFDAAVKYIEYHSI